MRKETIRYLLACILLAAGGSVYIFSSLKRGAPEYLEKTDFLLNTVVSIRIYGPPSSSEGEILLENAFKLISAYESELSRYQENSVVSKINRSPAKTPVPVSTDVFEILQKALEYARLSNGAFDPTVGPLVNLWDIGGENPRVPGNDEIAAALSLVDYKSLTLSDSTTSGKTVSFDSLGMSLDLGGITKGWIADKVGAYLIKNGARHILINLGGNILVFGGKPNGDPFKIGMQDPDNQRGQYLGVFLVSDGSVVSSGIYERFFESNGKRYHHILDTQTGRPAENGLAAVTILSDRSIDGDALSTAVFVLGLDSGMSLVDTLDGVEAAFVTREGTVVLSSGAAGMFTPSSNKLNVKIYGESQPSQ